MITTREEYISAIAAMPEIEYIEKPKRLYFNLEQGRSASCINTIPKNPQDQGGELFLAVPALLYRVRGF